MADFQGLLSEIGDRAAEAPSRPYAALQKLPIVIHAPHCDTTSPAQALAAYRLRQKEAPPERECEAPSPVLEFYQDLQRASASPEKLRALRREIAWRLHPDRRTEHACDAALARCNAAIDAALSRRPANSGE